MTIDQVKEYWDARPCNIRHGQTSIDEDPLQYSREVTARKFRVEPHIISHAEFHKWRDKRVLDLGCGIGTQALALARNDAVVVGVDVSSKSIETARRRTEAEGLRHRAVFWRADIEDLPALEEARLFDLVYSFGVIHHTPQPERAVMEAFRVLKPGGEFRLMVYNRLSWKAFWIIMTYGKGRFWKWRELIPRYSEAQSGCPITWTYSPREIRTILTTAGFEIERVWKDHIFPYRIDDYVQHRYVREWYWRLLPQKLFRLLERTFGWHLLVIARKP